MHRVLSESHASSLEELSLRVLGWDVAPLQRGDHAGQGMRALEYKKGVKTDRAIMWHPGGGHHGPSPYWKISSADGGTIRVGPQFQ